MHWDFVDIGTSDFDYSKNGKVLLVEPILTYLNNIPNKDNITKANYAIGLNHGLIDIHYIPPDVIDKHDLPYWLRGCNRIGEQHPLVTQHVGFDKNLVVVEKVKMITFTTLCGVYAIESIGVLKIDTEGYEIEILKSILEANIRIDKIDVESHTNHYSWKELEDVVKLFHYYDYNVLQDDSGQDRFVLTRCG